MADSIANVVLWGTTIGYVAWNNEQKIGTFQYEPKFLNAPVEPSPLRVPKSPDVYTFMDLNRATFSGLPGFLSDSLPDKFGNALIDIWLAKQGRSREDFNPVERLCYIGKRGMGALEFTPAVERVDEKGTPVEISNMVNLASQILSDRESVKEKLQEDDHEQMKDALSNLLLIGTSAGGARAKCLIAFNETTNEVRSGQIDAGDGFTYWLLKLDGVTDNKDKELADPKGYGRLEYAYHLMALAAGIEMTRCQLLEENGRAHFMTERFDRVNGSKVHMQSLCAIDHCDFNMAGAYSYELAIDTIRKVVDETTVQKDLEQLFIRAVFNVVNRNQDDHTKNIAFLMDKTGRWWLSPAYDITYSYNPEGEWTGQHQMSVNGKRDNFIIDDLIALGLHADLSKGKIRKIIKKVIDVAKSWETYAKKAGVREEFISEVSTYQRIDFK